MNQQGLGSIPDGDRPLIPVRMLNEFVYCPRLAYLMWVQGEFADNQFTVDGSIKHKRVDKQGGTLPKQPEPETTIHARSVNLSSVRIGITAKLDLVEGEGNNVYPVDYKRGKRPHLARGAYDPERVQVCAQGLLLREHGYCCEEGALYYVESKERVRIPFDDALLQQTEVAIRQFEAVAAKGQIPEPLVESAKCPHCSLIGICLPDEVGFLRRNDVEPRPIIPILESGLPLYVQSPRAYIRKKGAQFIIEVEKEKVADAKIGEVSQLVLYGSATLTTPALHECMRRNIPVTYLSYGGWFVGHTVGTGHKNVETRTAQYRASFDDQRSLALARGWVVAKIANCRTLLRRNWRDELAATALDPLLVDLKMDQRNAERAASLGSLLGYEGSAASRYFGHFGTMLKETERVSLSFDFNQRSRRPPKDPVNAMLSFAYAMLVREWTVALAAVGLDPYRGFYHQPRYGRPALALDMMEPFRPLIADSVVVTAINNGEVHLNDFIHAVGSCNLTDSGRKRFIATFERRMNHEISHPIFKYRISYRRLLEVQARLLIRYLTEEISTYPNFVTR